MTDAGYKWEELSIFDATSFSNKNFFNTFPNGFNEFNKIDIYLNKTKPLLSINKSKTYKDFFYIYLDLNLFDDLKNSSSGLGLQNDWVNLQIGRGKESWGSGENIHLALNDKSSSYDYFKLSSNYGNLRVSYVHGFLEKYKNSINRFINARGIEWTNRSWLILGLSETIIYSGMNRPLDIGYLNPISSHLEVEMNDRLNISGTSSANAVWQVHMDILFKKKSRISINYLYDELVIDPEIEIGKENGRALSARYSFCKSLNNQNLINFFFSYVNVGTPTFRHGEGTNNFVHMNIPLGWNGGSDSESFEIGFNYFDKNRILLEIGFNNIKSGEDNISQRPYEPYRDYLKGKFPSGEVTNSNRIELNLIFKTKLNLDMLFNYQINLENKNAFNYLMGVRLSV